MNDWLNDEFKRRVSSKRKVVLTDKLSEGLRLLSVQIPRKIEKAEEDLTNKYNSLKDLINEIIPTYEKLSVEDTHKMWINYLQETNQFKK